MADAIKHLIYNREDLDYIIDLSYRTITTRIQKKNIDLESAEYQKIIYKNIFDDLDIIEKYAEKLLRSLKKPNARVKALTKLNKICKSENIECIIASNIRFIEILDKAEIDLVVLNNILSSLSYIIYMNSFNLKEEQVKNIYALWSLINDITFNIKEKLEADLKSDEYERKGFQYVDSKNNLNISLAIDYLLEKIKEMGFNTTIIDYFNEQFGKEYFALELLNK